ncbi:MAG: LysR family transcriptional regulator [Lachnospiraceae bacterium]|nr:LysR family transcriptional regulator [Lachnospiraceae bacterium]
MNILHMKYAVEVARTNSINKAAEELFVGAPALSRAIKELEAGLGVTLFDRSAKGMSLTPDGELFVSYAEKALKQIEDIEAIFKDGTTAKKQFSLSAPRASYIAAAFAEFSKKIAADEDIELFYKETNAYRVINNLIKDDFKLGILRYSEQYESYYRQMMSEKGLVGELITEFTYVLIMSKKSPLASKERISAGDLNGLTEIAHGDPYVPSLSFSEVKKYELPDHKGSRIYVFERSSQFELLSKNLNTYMWVSPIPEDLLERYGLTTRVSEDSRRVYKDVLIHRKDYTLSELDRSFIEELTKAKRKVF